MIERREEYGSYLPVPETALRAAGAAFEEMLRPCSRFTIPADHVGLWKARIARSLYRHDPMSGGRYMLNSGQPLNWLLLLSYLHEKHIAGEPLFQFHTHAPHDLPPLRARVRVPGVTACAETDGRSVERYGFGHAMSLDHSCSSAVGELLERHCMSVYRNRDLREGTRADMGVRALNPASLNGFLPWQKTPDFRGGCGPDARFRWARGVELLSGSSAWIPAQLAFWNYARDLTCGEPRIVETNTNGCGGGFTFEEAAVSGLLELIERDAFLIHWLNMLSPRKVDITSANAPDAESRDLLASLERYRVPYHFLDITSDLGIPTLVCALTDDRGDVSAVAIGSKAGFDLSQLIAGSATEALATLASIAGRRPLQLSAEYRPFVDPLRIAKYERVRLWQGRDMFERFAFFVANKETVSQEAFMSPVSAANTAPPSVLAFLLSHFHEMGEGYEVYAKASEHPVLDAVGYHAVHMIVPRLVSLYLVETSATLDAPRLREVPGKLGHRAAETYNPWPHPFP